MAALGTLTVAEVNDAIESTFTSDIDFTESYDELSESINDTPTLQVYWVSLDVDPDSDTSKRTMGSGSTPVVQYRWTYYADLFARQRNELAEDMAALYPLVDAMINTMAAQANAKFGVAIKALVNWRADQLILEVDDNTQFVGARFTIVVQIF